MQDSPDKTGISLVCCQNEKDLLAYGADRIAQELVGKDLPRVFPTFLIFYHGRLRGFFQARQQTVLYSGLHPDKISPREFLKISRSLITEVKRMTGNPIFMLCNYADKFGPKNLSRVRLKRAEETAYIYDEEAP